MNVSWCNELFLLSYAACSRSSVAGIERVADAVAKQVEGEYRHGDGQPREDEEPVGAGQEAAAAVEHFAPVCSGRLDAEPQETQARQAEDREADSEARLYRQGAERCRQDVAEQFPGRAHADRRSCLHEFFFPRAEHDAA